MKTLASASAWDVSGTLKAVRHSTGTPQGTGTANRHLQVRVLTTYEYSARVRTSGIRIAVAAPHSSLLSLDSPLHFSFLTPARTPRSPPHHSPLHQGGHAHAITKSPRTLRNAANETDYFAPKDNTNLGHAPETGPMQHRASVPICTPALLHISHLLLLHHAYVERGAFGIHLP